MSERRVEPFTGRVVLLATSRRGLGAPRPGGLPRPPGPCPFCPGRESETETTIHAWPAEGPWRVRVVRNKYPLVSAVDGHGDHEVVIESRSHDDALASMSVAHLEGLLGVVRARVRALEAREEIAAVTPFRNRGVRSGSSQPHPHAQIIATTYVPSDAALRWARARAEPVYARELERELAGPRLLAEDPHLATFCPWAPIRPFEVRFAPRAPAGGLGAATDAELASLASSLRAVCGALDALGVGDFNLVFRTPPAGARGPAATWHLDLIPRRGGDAGFELGTRDHVVVVAPEEAAEAYRAALAARGASTA